MLAPQELQILLALASVGIVLMNLIYLSLTLVLRLTLKIRLSWASVIAAMTMCWTVKILVLAPLLTVLPAETVENRWATGLFMLMMVLVYVFFLLAFQPDSLKALTIKNLKETELKKNEFLLDYLKKGWKKASHDKDQDAMDELDKKIAEAQDERKVIKRHYSKFNWVYNLFSRKKQVAEPAAAD